RRGYPVHMVHRAIANPLVDRWLCELRRRAGTRMIRKSAGAGGVLQALHERGLLVLPIDQNSTRGLGVFVDFFGLPASTNSGMARIALRTDAPIVPAFHVRELAAAQRAADQRLAALMRELTALRHLEARAQALTRLLAERDTALEHQARRIAELEAALLRTPTQLG